MRRSHMPTPVRVALTITALGLVSVVGLHLLLPAADASRLSPVAVPALATASAPPPSPPTLPPTPLPTPTADPTATVLPTATPLPPLPTPTATPAPAPTLLPAAVHLHGLRHFWQTWNNCGPATLAMNLSYYGSTLDQATIGAALRRHPDDKNVGPEELAAYARSQGFHATVRVGGTAQTARAFLAAGIPLLIETWLEETPGDGLGHYRLLVGYDDAGQRWIAYDSYVGRDLVNPDPARYQGIYLDVAETEALWRVFNYTYVLIYPPERAAEVAAILGASLDPAVMWQERLVAARAAVAANPGDPFAHFNLGSTLVELGDYSEAAAAFDQARAGGLPWRMLWYQFGPFAAYTETGRYHEVLELGRATLASAGTGIEEIHYWRGRAAAGLGDLATARAEWSRALALNPDYTPPRLALDTLP